MCVWVCACIRVCVRLFVCVCFCVCVCDPYCLSRYPSLRQLKTAKGGDSPPIIIQCAIIHFQIQFLPILWRVWYTWRRRGVLQKMVGFITQLIFICLGFSRSPIPPPEWFLREMNFFLKNGFLDHLWLCCIKDASNIRVTRFGTFVS